MQFDGDGSGVRRSGGNNLLCIEPGSELRQVVCQGAGEDRLGERTEQGGAKVLAEYDDRCSDRSFGGGQRVLDCDEWLNCGIC